MVLEGIMMEVNHSRAIHPTKDLGEQGIMALGKIEGEVLES